MSDFCELHLMSSHDTRDLYRMIPPLHLVRLAGMGLDFRKLVIGALGLLLICVFNEKIADRIETNVWGEFRWNWPVADLFSPEGDDVWRLTYFGPSEVSLVPPEQVVRFYLRFFMSNESAYYRFWLLVRAVLPVVVWTFTGLAVCRMAAEQFARRNRIGIISALAFARRKFVPCLIAETIIFGGVVLLWLILAGAGVVLSRVPEAGSVVAGFGWGAALVCGFLMTMLSIGLLVGWPLIVAAISTEDGDAYDGLSRAFGYIVDRPLHLLCYLLAGSLVGVFGWVVLNLIVIATARFTITGFAAGFGFDNANRFLTDVSPQLAPFADRNSGVWFWMSILRFLRMAYVPVYFWCSTTVVYFLLRQSVDGTELTEIGEVSIANSGRSSAPPEVVVEASSPNSPAEDDEPSSD